MPCAIRPACRSRSCRSAPAAGSTNLAWNLPRKMTSPLRATVLDTTDVEGPVSSAPTGSKSHETDVVVIGSGAGSFHVWLLWLQ
jgi:hypothetical protein